MKAILILASVLTAHAFAQDTQTLFAEAQRDYIRGDRTAAKEKFTLVSKADPNNKVAANYLRRIAMEEKNAGGDQGAQLRARLDKIVIERIDFRDATVGEALEFLSKKISSAAPGENKINIVQQLTEEAKGTRITLTLNNVPASEALRYTSDLAGLSLSYERFAVVVKPKEVAK